MSYYYDEYHKLLNDVSKAKDRIEELLHVNRQRVQEHLGDYWAEGKAQAYETALKILQEVML